MILAAARHIDRGVDRWLAPMPATRLAALRVLIMGFGTIWIVARAPYWVDLSRLADPRWRPVGLFASSSDAPGPTLVTAIAIAAFGAGVAATAGWRFRVTGPLFATGLLVLTTFGSGWSQIFHTENLLVLHVGILACSPAALAWSIDARRRTQAADGGRPETGSRGLPDGPVPGWSIRLMGAVTALTYLVAGIAKLRIGGLDWLTGEALANHVAADNLRKILVDDTHSAIGGWLVAHAWVFTPLAWASFLVELGAPFAVACRRTRVAWVAAAWSFHVGVLALMAIFFPYQLLGFAFMPYFAMDEAAVSLRGRLGRTAEIRAVRVAR